jgi:hypothetical protein
MHHTTSVNKKEGEANYMSIVKYKAQRKNYMVVSKLFLQDPNLSLAERGLLATLLSLPGNWQFSIEGMQHIMPDGKDRIKSALNGLIKKASCTI